MLEVLVCISKFIIKCTSKHNYKYKYNAHKYIIKNMNLF